MKKTLIFIDKDKTLIYDKKYYFGSQKNWRSLIKILPHVINGLKLLKKIQNSKIYIITNQPGVAVKNFPLLTLKRANEVCKYVLKQFEKRNVKLDGYEICERVSPLYIKTHKQFTFNKKLVGNFYCMKPNPGMIEKILKKEKLTRADANIYVIGDRVSDVKTALNAKGFGIIIPFENEKDEKEKVRKLKNKSTFIAKNFLDAARFIVKREKL